MSFPNALPHPGHVFSPPPPLHLDADSDAKSISSLIPETPMTASLPLTSNTMDELTRALANFSRPTDSEPVLVCCCGREDCESTRAWEAAREKMDKGLVLSAEVGQALLLRHEAYVHHQESLTKKADENARLYSFAKNKIETLHEANEQLISKMADLVKELSHTEKRLAQTQINLDVADASNRTLLNSVQESRTAIARLSAQNARAAGWETRLTQVEQEREDALQECQAAVGQAKALEMKAVAAESRCEDLLYYVAQLETELFRLKTELDSSRDRQSEEILKDARARLQAFQNTFGQTLAPDDSEAMHVLESLVADNEALKRDNKELQSILAETREDVQSLREEVDEQRAIEPLNEEFAKVGSPPKAKLVPPPRRRSSNASSLVKRRLSNDGSSSELSTAVSRSSTFSQPPSPSSFLARIFPLASFVSSAGRPFSPTESLADVSNVKCTSFGQLRPRYYASSHVSFEVDVGAVSDSQVAGPSNYHAEAKRRRSYRQSQSRGVQTDSPTAPFSLGSYLPASHARLQRNSPDSSDTTSLDEQAQVSPLPRLIKSVSALLVRMSQADIQTLNSRLKRQGLAGAADLGHISRTTISGILLDASNLRTQFRGALEMEKHEMARKDLRGLFNLFNDMFAELASLRTTANEVTLDPSRAAKLRAEAIQSKRSDSADQGISALMRSSTSTIGRFAAPIITKLFPGNVVEDSDGERRHGGSGPSAGTEGARRIPTARPRFAAKKLAPATSASATTVNVEFAITGNRSVSTAVENMHASSSVSSSSATTGEVTVRPGKDKAKAKGKAKEGAAPRESLLGIFAGAPGQDPDGWVMLPNKAKLERRESKKAVVSFADHAGTLKTKKETRVGHVRRMTRTVDAVVDQLDAPEFESSLLERTLLHRGLSDSSIHTTFATSSPVKRLLTPATMALAVPTVLEHAEMVPGTASSSHVDRETVMKTLSEKIQGLKQDHATSSSGPSNTERPAQTPVVAITSEPATQKTTSTSPPTLPIPTGHARPPVNGLPSPSLSHRRFPRFRADSPALSMTGAPRSSWTVGAGPYPLYEGDDMSSSMRDESALSRRMHRRGRSRDLQWDM
ncbi:hypothetical protein BOTBODRAFT_173928 [Botryobasidium botryosum FD-172 SS1]|uniref:Uncharacterized protein n=1 Tax=Botryobasidium botryosum (strain FD-172 SS1) TaxID=930990 RepID=A0A067MI50_BOTB1|nr:hypothetical protein BOTBODRAFT_173928 [Botryobasidium botryosum FD-172 SS1]